MIAIQKNRKIGCLFRRALGAVPRLSILYKFKQSSIQKEHGRLSISLGNQLKRGKRRKRVVLKNRCEIFRDNNHQSLHKNIKMISA